MRRFRILGALVPLCLGTSAVSLAQPIQSLGVAGDSLSNEYDEFGYSVAKSWTQILVQFRGIDMGPRASDLGMQGWGDYRNWGNQNNYSIPGATTDGLVLSQGPEHLADAVATRGVSHIVIAASGNDMASWNNFVYLNMYYDNWTQRRRDAYADASIANVRQAVQTVHASGAKVVLLNMPDFNVMPFYHDHFPIAESRAQSTAVVQRINAGLHDLAVEFQIPLVDLFALDRTVFGPDDQPKQTLMVGGVAIQLRQSDPDGTHPTYGFVADSVHLNTILQEVWANAVIAALNAGYHTEIPLLSEPEMLQIAGITVPAPVHPTLTSQIGSAAHYVFVGTCEADFNASGTLDVQDIFDFVNAWLENDPRADINGSGACDIPDIFAYLSMWLSGC